MAIQCTICMSNLSVNEAANAASCGHVFHEPCLVQWFQRSKTCPQCRARCDDRQVRRLYFSAALNSSTVDVDSLQVDLDDIKLEMRNVNTELDAKKTEVKRLRDRQETTKLALIGLEADLKLARVQLQNANSQIASYKSELDRLRAVEKELNEKMQQTNNLDYIKSVIESDAVIGDVAELLQSPPDIKSLATLVSVCKHELIKVKRNRDEVKNNRRVCQDENTKLKKRIKDLTDKINTLESDNYKLQDDLSQMKRNNEPNTSRNEDITPSTSSSPSSSIQPVGLAVRSITSTTSAPPRIESPYLNIRQSNVGLSPLLNHRKRKPDAEGLLGSTYSNLTIFNNRQKVSKATVSGAQSSSLIYNGFGGSERKENFVGFPNGQSKSNPAGRMLSLSSSKNGVTKK